MSRLTGLGPDKGKARARPASELLVPANLLKVKERPLLARDASNASEASSLANDYSG
jgi:hypothetical protein